MKHFDVTDWADFVRSVAADIDRTAMEQHLLSGCSLCRRTVAGLRRTAELVKLDDSFEPPVYVVRRARNILASQHPEKLSTLNRLVPRLIYDSLREPSLAGMRARQRPGRQLLYQAGDFFVDLQFELVPNARQVRVLGQIANQKDPTLFSGTRPVLLKSGRRTIRRATTSEFQEFQLEYEPKPGMRLEIPVPSSRRSIEVLLEDVISAVPDPQPPTPEPVDTRPKPRPRSRKASRRR